MPRVAVAAPSQIAADAGVQVAEQGGNAVDAAIAAALVACVTEPGVCALGAGGFFTVWASEEQEPLTIDGYMEMPGRGLPTERFGRALVEIQLEYGGGTTTVVGHGSVATPGALAAASDANLRFGRLPWRVLLEPVIDWARRGFPLSEAAASYLTFAHQEIFGRTPESYQALHRSNGEPLRAGDIVHVEHLADSLTLIAEQGAAAFYHGELARLIAEDIEANGGILTAADLDAYRPRHRRPLRDELGPWRVATNPPPAIGGVTLTAMLKLMHGHPQGGWSPQEVARLVQVQQLVLDFRRQHLDGSEDVIHEAVRILELAEGAEWRAQLTSPATVHISAVDDSGLACATTLSAGYGSGVMPPGTGIWLNNSLGEIELNSQGLHAQPPGSRLVSNMAPTVARRADGAVLAIGSPGADRITTALLQTLVNFANLGLPLQQAVDHPRLHLLLGDAPTVAFEPGLPIDHLALPTRPFPTRDMFFGGVAAALWEPAKGFHTAADPRRTGGTAVGGR